MLPVLFRVGSFPVHSWGLLLMIGFLLGSWGAAKNARRYNIAGEHLWDVALWGLLGGVLGGRLAYVLQNLGHFSAHPGQIFAIWTGGMTFYGGLIGGILAGAIVCRLRGISVADTADLAAVTFPIGYFFGRIGCFLNGCCFGGHCDPPLGMRFHLPEGGLTAPSHPAQLYSAGAAVLMYLVLVGLERRRAFPGQLMWAFLFLYGLYRFGIEFVRAGVTADVTPILGLTTGQIFSLALALVAALFYAAAARRRRRASSGGGEPPVAPRPAGRGVPASR